MNNIQQQKINPYVSLAFSISSMLAVMKWLHIIKISWTMVLCPIWIPIALIILFILMVLIGTRISDKAWNKIMKEQEELENY